MGYENEPGRAKSESSEGDRMKLEEIEKELGRLALEVKALKKKPWEPSGGRYWITGFGDVRKAASNNECRTHGSEWDTEQKAKIAAKKVRIFQWMLHMADELGCNEKNLNDIFSGLYLAIFNGANFQENKDNAKARLYPLLEELRELIK
jgi:hypothetical protein